MPCVCYSKKPGKFLWSLRVFFVFLYKILQTTRQGAQFIQTKIVHLAQNKTLHFPYLNPLIFIPQSPSCHALRMADIYQLHLLS